MVKKCFKCKRLLDIKFFYKRKKSKDGIDIYCIDCRKSEQKKWVSNNPDKIREKQNKWYQKNKDIIYAKRVEREKRNPIKAREQRRIHTRRYTLKKKYNLTIEEYNKIFDCQKGKCAICGLTSKKILRIDHDHKTGKVRSLLCDRCNIMLGYYEMDNNFHIKASEYLMKH